MMCRSSSRTARSTSAPLGSASSSAWAPSASAEGAPRWHRPGSSGTRTLSSASTLVLSMIHPPAAGGAARRITAPRPDGCSCLLEATPLAGLAPAGRDVVLRPVPPRLPSGRQLCPAVGQDTTMDTPSCVTATILVNLAAVNGIIAARGRQCRRRDGAVPTAVWRARVAPLLAGHGVTELRRPHPYHSCCRAPVVEGAEVKRPGVSVADRGEPEARVPRGTEMARPVRTTAAPALWRRTSSGDG
jgi:hypothetical protein